MTPSSCFRRAMICGMASLIGSNNSASNWYQHSLSDTLQKSHIVQTVLTMHLHQQVGCYHPEGGQWSGGLPPQLVPKTQLQINISMVWQADDWRDLTLFGQFWQCICTHVLDVCVIVLEKCYNLWHCLLNWWPKLSFKLVLAWPFKEIAEISHCSDSFDNAPAPIPWIYSLLSWRRATICGIASPIGARNTASNWYQHGLSGRLLRSHNVQTVLTMHLHQHIGFPHHCAAGGQQSVALPPQSVPETQLQIDQHGLASRLQTSHNNSHCSDSSDNMFAPVLLIVLSLCWRRATIFGIASTIEAWNSASKCYQHDYKCQVDYKHLTLFG